jgi:hypothetical protein
VKKDATKGENMDDLSDVTAALARINTELEIANDHLSWIKGLLFMLLVLFVGEFAKSWW